jgi:hypothetical protein
MLKRKEFALGNSGVWKQLQQRCFTGSSPASVDKMLLCGKKEKKRSIRLHGP